ncbi:amidase [Microbacterium aurantiacum]|uniref:Amidase n=1 Tax=Microbacterium aurantiacum TaxID=162393 RepID=A0AAJ2HB88_9MICO|nr:amidase [Microbacterium aurantiacum]MDS0244277.1 amidase [Microbacterium aurantiacum]
MSALDLSARALVAATSTGELSPVEVIDDLARRVSGVATELNPFLAIDLDTARDTARSLQERPPEERGALHGLPLPLKDLERTADLPTTFGLSFPLAPDAPRTDGSFAARARAAGAILYAKTNTSAFGHKDVTENLIVGATTNPWDTTRTPGGSSGGSAALVAAGVAPVAHGTDAGGSVRFPASMVGVVGFKPSFGRLPRIPAPDLWAARGHHGFLANDVADIAFLMDALSGQDLRDPLSPAGSWRALPAAKAPRALYVETMFGQDVDVDVRRVMDEAIDALVEAGVDIRRGRIEWDDPIADGNIPMVAREWRLLGARAEREPELFDASHLEQIRAGAAVTADDLMRAQESRTKLYGAAAALFEDYELLLMPTMPLTAWRWDDEHPAINGVPTERGPGGRWMDVLLGNLTGWPAISVPCGWSKGLPVGLHITAAPLHDFACIDAAARFEEILQFTRPALPAQAATKR